MNPTVKNLLLVVAAASLLAFPLLFNGQAQFTGSDGQGQELIGEINPAYQPWFASVWTPPSKEIESGIFSLQAALGAGFLGYYLGLSRGRRSGKKEV